MKERNMNKTCCPVDKARCPAYARELRAGTITKEGVIVFVLLIIGIILQVLLCYMFRKRWKIGTARWKRNRVTSTSQNSGRDQDVAEYMPKSDDYKAPTENKDTNAENVFEYVSSHDGKQSHGNRPGMKQKVNKGDHKQKSTETVYSDNSLVYPLVQNSQGSTPSTKEKFEKDYDYASSILVQSPCRAATLDLENSKESPVVDQRGRTVREKRPTPCRNQKAGKTLKSIRSKLPSPPSRMYSKRQKKSKPGKVEETEYLDWGTCHTKVVKGTRNLNTKYLSPIPRDRGATRSMSLDITSSLNRNISNDFDDDSDTDDSKEEFTPQLTWYIQKLKEKHPYMLQRSKTGYPGRKRYGDKCESKTLGAKSSQSLGVMFILDKNKSVSVEDDLEKRSSADYLAIIDARSRNEQETILEEGLMQTEADCLLLSEEKMDNTQCHMTVIKSTLKSEGLPVIEAQTTEGATYAREEVVYMANGSQVHEITESTVVDMHSSEELLTYTEDKPDLLATVCESII